MGIANIFRRAKLTDNATVQLTATGKQKADNFEGEGEKFAVLGALAENGGVCTVKEIADDAHISIDKAVRVIKVLMAAKYIKKAGASEGE